MTTPSGSSRRRRSPPKVSIRCSSSSCSAARPPSSTCSPRRASAKARASVTDPTSLGARAVVSAAGAAAIARNGWSAASGPSGSCPARGNSDSSRPSSRRSQKPAGGSVIAVARIGSAIRPSASSRSIAAVSIGAVAPNARPSSFSPAAGSAPRSSLCFPTDQPHERRGGRPPLDHRHAVQLLEDARRLRIVERRQQRRRTRERRAARVERRLLGLVGDDQHPESAPRQQRRRDQARRLAPTDDHVVEVRVDHAAWSYRLRNGAFPGAAPRTRTRRPSTTTRRSAIARTTAGSRRCSSARMRARSASSSSSS